MVGQKAKLTALGLGTEMAPSRCREAMPLALMPVTSSVTLPMMFRIIDTPAMSSVLGPPRTAQECTPRAVEVCNEHCVFHTVLPCNCQCLPACCLHGHMLYSSFEVCTLMGSALMIGAVCTVDGIHSVKLNSWKTSVVISIH